MFLQVCFPNANLALWSVYPLYGCIVLWKKDSIGNLIYNIIADSDYFIFFLGRFGLQVCNLVMISILTSPRAYGRREDLRYVKWLSCFFFMDFRFFFCDISLIMPMFSIDISWLVNIMFRKSIQLLFLKNVHRILYTLICIQSQYKCVLGYFTHNKKN